MSMRKLFLLIVLVALISSGLLQSRPSSAQGEIGSKAYNEWRLVEVRDISGEIQDAVQGALPEYIFDRRAASDSGRVASRVVHSSLSPNGEFILVSLQLGDPSPENTGGLCLYIISNQNINCSLMPPFAYFESESLLRWSPDWRYVVFHTNFVEFQRNSDLWLFDSQTGLAENITPDAAPGARWGSEESFSRDVYFDGAVTWQATSRSFYFWRYILGTDRPVSAYLMNYQIGNSAPTEVAYFATITEPIIGYARQVALSPDESQLAFVTYNAQPFDRAVNIYNLADQTTQQLITGRELRVTWNDDKNLFIENVQWQGEELFMYMDRDNFTFVPEYIRLNPATGDIQTMVEVGLERSADTIPYFNQYSVRWSAISANQDVLLYFSEGNLFTLPTSLEGEPHLLGEFTDTLLYEPRELYQITENGRLLIGGFLFQFE